MPNTFPLPVSLFSRETMDLCTRALDEAWTMLGSERERFVMSPEIVRLTLAQGIALSVTTGVREHRRLVKAALEHLDMTTERCLPPLEPLQAETTRRWKDPARFRYRASELWAVADGLSSAEAREATIGVAREYERMARSAERIEASLKKLNGLAPLQDT